MRNLLAVTLLVICCYASASNNEMAAHKHLKVVSMISPEFANKDGTGFYLSLARYIFKPLGYSVELETHPFKRAIYQIATNSNVDIMFAGWSQEYPQSDGIKVITPKHPVSAEFVVAVFREESSIGWKDVQQGENLEVAWINGYNYNDVLDVSQHSINRVSNTENGLKMLLRGHIDCYLDDKQDVTDVIASNVFSDQEYRFETVLMRKLYPLFRDDKEGRALMAQYDKRMHKLIANGDIYRFYLTHNLNYKEVDQEEFTLQ